MHIKKLKVHTCGCISRCCGCNHRTGGNQWCTQYKCQYVPQENCAFHMAQWRRKAKPRQRSLIEEQREAQAIVMEGLKKRWAAEEAEQHRQLVKHEQESYAPPTFNPLKETINIPDYETAFPLRCDPGEQFALTEPSNITNFNSGCHNCSYSGQITNTQQFMQQHPEYPLQQFPQPNSIPISSFPKSDPSRLLNNFQLTSQFTGNNPQQMTSYQQDFFGMSPQQALVNQQQFMIPRRQIAATDLISCNMNQSNNSLFFNQPSVTKNLEHAGNKETDENTSFGFNSSIINASSFQQQPQHSLGETEILEKGSNTNRIDSSSFRIDFNSSLQLDQHSQELERGILNEGLNTNNNMSFYPRDPQFLDCFPQHKQHIDNQPDQTACFHDNLSFPMTSYGQDFADRRTCSIGVGRAPTVADCYGIQQMSGYGAQRSGYGAHPSPRDSYHPTGYSNTGSGDKGMPYGECFNEAEKFQTESCPYAKPLSDIMEPRHYLYGSPTWKGVPLPFEQSEYELLLPSSHGTFQLLPSPNPFVYIGRKRRGPEDRFHGPEQPLPVSAKRPEVFGNEYGIEQTTNHLGYRPQRRHFKERPSFILFN